MIVKTDFEKVWKDLQDSPPEGFEIIKARNYQDNGDHPASFIDFECNFAAQELRGIKSKGVLLDVGSYRHFVIGLASQYTVLAMDIRSPTGFSPVSGCGESRVIVGDAKSIPLPNESVDMVVSLCSLEHFGMARYGDELDLDGDKKGFREMLRVLRPGGSIIFSTTVTKGQPCYCHNAHRIYSIGMVKRFCTGLTMTKERYYSGWKKAPCELESVTKELGRWDIYCGHWKKSI